MIFKKILRSLGYDVRRIGTSGLTNRDLEYDLPRVLPKPSSSVFDVGANKGQTIEMMQRLLIDPRIYSFEPSSDLATLLRAKFDPKRVTVEQCGLGAAPESRTFIHYQVSELSSFLPLSKDAHNPFSKVNEQGREELEIRTVDSYAEANAIDHIDLLKIDTQGFDFEVLKGSEAMIVGGRVSAVLVELNFAQLYANQCGPGEVIDWLGRRGFSILGFYDEVRINPVLSWVTVLFLPQSFRL